MITTLLLEEHARHGAVSLREFYRRRALRLLPALFVLLAVFLTVSAVAVLISGGSLDRAVFGVAAGIGYFSNVAMSAEPGTMAMPNELRHLWSLAIEEQFYLVWPLVLLIVLRARIRLALVVLLALVGLTVYQQIRLYSEGASAERIGFGTDTHGTPILIGCALAVALATSARPTVEAIARAIAPLAGVGIAILLMVVPGQRFFSAWILAVGLCSAWLILRTLDGRSLVSRLLSVRPLVFLGRISYALYLWHIPIYVTFGVSTSPELLDVPALALSLACAIASYYFVERPFLRKKRRARPQLVDQIQRGSDSPALTPASS